MRTVFRSIILFVFFILIFTIFDKSQNLWSLEETGDLPPYLTYESNWAKMNLQKLDFRQSTGQMILLPAYPQEDTLKWAKLGDIIEQNYVGGIVVYKGHAASVAAMINYLQSRAKIPLLVMIDADFDIQSLIDSAQFFPNQEQIEQISDNSVLYELGTELSAQLKRIGIHGIFAPDVFSDKLTIEMLHNEKYRSFKKNKLFSLMKSFSENRILSVLDYNKGMGISLSDSLFTPELNYLIKKGLGAIRLTNGLDDSLDISFLRNDLSYRGILFGNAVFVKDSSQNNDNQALQKSITDGNNFFFYQGKPEDLPQMIDSVQQKKAELDSAIKESLKKIMHLKYWLGLQKYKAKATQNIISELNAPKTESIVRKAMANCIILMQNKDNMIPLKGLERTRIYSISFGQNTTNALNNRLKAYTKINEINLPKRNFKEILKAHLRKTNTSDILIFSIFETNQYTADYGVDPEILSEIESIATARRVIFVSFAPADALKKLKNPSHFGAIIQANSELAISQDYAAQLIFGGMGASGVLSYPLGRFTAFTGYSTEKNRLKYAIPEEFGIDRAKLTAIDSIIQDAIDKKAFPGCQIVALKDGAVFFEGNYGFTDYRKKTKIQSDHIYDLASLTKVLATAPVLMHLYQHNKFDIEKRLKDYIPGTDTTNKGDIKMKDILLHQARLAAWIPFYLYTYNKGSRSLRADLYTKKPDSLHTTQVANQLFILNSYKDSIFSRILTSSLNRRNGYKYSDLGFYLFTRIIEIQSGSSISKLTDSLFYSKLGARTLTYNPLRKFPIDQIVPTENDISFRRQLLQGHVHDYGAAMLGGVAGHAGLFGSAGDVAKFMQMLLNKGEYGGEQLISRDAVDLFVSRPPKSNRRALIFDMKPVNGNAASVSRDVSDLSFGHTGFTGTLVWVDPENDFIFIFLSNRIHPDIENDKILKMSIRPKIHQVFYNAMKN